MTDNPNERERLDEARADEVPELINVAANIDAYAIRVAAHPEYDRDLAEHEVKPGEVTTALEKLDTVVEQAEMDDITRFTDKINARAIRVATEPDRDLEGIRPSLNTVKKLTDWAHEERESILFRASDGRNE